MKVPELEPDLQNSWNTISIITTNKSRKTRESNKEAETVAFLALKEKLNLNRQMLLGVLVEHSIIAGSYVL